MRRCRGHFRIRQGAVALAAALVSSGIAPGAPAQPTATDFGGVRYPQAAVAGRLAFRAQRAWAWPGGDSRRLLLTGDVRVTLAQHEFVAKRAAVWMQTISPPGAPETMQVFMVLDEVGDPAQPAAMGIAAARLPVRAILTLEGKVSLACDSLVASPPPAKGPDAAFIAESEALLANSLARATGAPAPNAPPPLPPLPTITPRPVSGVPSGTGAAARASSTTATPSTSTTPPTPAAVTPAPDTRPSAPPTARGTAAIVPPPRDHRPAAEVATPAPAAPMTRAPSDAAPVEPSRRAPAVKGDAIFAKEGYLTLSAKDISVVSGEDENAVMATDGVIVVYQDAKTGRTLQLTARRAVVFTDPGPLRDMARFGADNVRGLFLEGDVTGTDGLYTVRAPHVYYDVRNNKAVMLDAVFWTYDEKRRLPLYVRAKAVRQTSADQFTAEQAVLTNSAFFDPELSIGASAVTLTRASAPQAPDSPLDAAKTGPNLSTVSIDARDITVRGADVPFFYWPKYSGDPSRPPLRAFGVRDQNGSGVTLTSTWDAYSLLGLERPNDTRFDLIGDLYFERGLGLGGRMSWDSASGKGGAFGYTLPYDFGEDTVQPGTKVDREGEFRGILTAEQRWRIDESWSIYAEGSLISDSTFVPAFFQELGQTRREFTNRLRPERTVGNSALSIDMSGSFNDFISNEYLLQSKGYSVTRLPEAVYARQADDLLKDSHPGLVSWWSEYRAGALQLGFDEKQAAGRGFNTDALAQRAFGFNADQSYGEVLRQAGLTEDIIGRADTRQEIAINANAGPVKITPFVVGRGTAWSSDFEPLSGEDFDHGRLWGAAGMRASTTVQRVYDEADSSLLDVHRLRHIVTPNVAAWYAGSSVNSGDLPVYDQTVEPLAAGLLTKVGVTQVFQTQRGGPGRWHSTDLLTLTTDFYFADGQAEQVTPIGRYYDPRPEYSNPGNYFLGDLVYRLTDATAITGSIIHDFDLSGTAYGSGGVIIRHSPDFSTATDVRYVEALDSTFLNFTVEYELTRKYAALAGAAYDFDEGGFQSAYIEVRRKSAAMMLGVAIGYNDITGDTSFGVIFRPYGAGGAGRFMGSAAGTELR